MRQVGDGRGLSVRLDGTTDRYVDDVEVLREVACRLDWEPPPNLTLRLHDVRLVTRKR